jgi:hypothetical protein
MPQDDPVEGQGTYPDHAAEKAKEQQLERRRMLNREAQRRLRGDHFPRRHLLKSPEANLFNPTRATTTEPEASVGTAACAFFHTER